MDEITDQQQLWQRRLDEYLRHRSRNGLAEKTPDRDQSALQQWIQWSLDTGRDPALFEEYGSEQLQEIFPGCADASAKLYLQIAKSWCEWCHEQPWHTSTLPQSNGEDDTVDSEQIWLGRLEQYLEYRRSQGQTVRTLGDRRRRLKKWIHLSLQANHNPAEYSSALVDDLLATTHIRNQQEKKNYSRRIEVWCDWCKNEPWSRQMPDVPSNCWVVRASAGGEDSYSNRRMRRVTVGFNWNKWGDLASFERCTSRADLGQLIDDRTHDMSRGRRYHVRDQIWRFGREIEIGDLVVMPQNKASGGTICIGRIEGTCDSDATQPDRQQLYRPVEWLATDVDRYQIKHDLNDSLKRRGTVFRVNCDDAAYRLLYLAQHGLDPGPRYAGVYDASRLPGLHNMNLEALAEEMLVEEAFLADIAKLLDDKGQVILYGPPGTGKTYLAQRLARAIISANDVSNLDAGLTGEAPASQRLSSEESARASAGSDSGDSTLVDGSPVAGRDNDNAAGNTSGDVQDSKNGRDGSSAYSLVQFHPAYSYEDFFEGYRPRVDDSGQMTYVLTPGPLVRIAERAVQQPHERHVMVIDEINRANLPRVLGELLYLLEYRDEAIHTQYRPDAKFSLPKNLWFIGTMNTADRSIALIDAAMRRRFHFVPFFPSHGPTEGLLRRWMDEHSPGQRWIAALVDAVNDELADAMGGEHMLIGPSHFMKDDLDEDALRLIWEYNIEPLIEDQLFGRHDVIDQFRFDSVLKQHGPRAQAARNNSADTPPNAQGPGDPQAKMHDSDLGDTAGVEPDVEGPDQQDPDIHSPDIHSPDMHDPDRHDVVSEPREHLDS